MREEREKRKLDIKITKKPDFSPQKLYPFISLI
jgi:hypothetical protein